MEPYAAPTAPRDTTGETLALVAGILGIVFTILGGFYALMMLFMMMIFDDMAREFGMPAFMVGATGLIWVIVLAFIVLNIVGCVLVFQGKTLAARQDPGGFTRVLVGSCLLIPGASIAGILGIVGAVLIKSEMDKQAARPVA